LRTVLVAGAGAAGLMAAIFAARRGCRVVLLDTTRDGGRKILISGGGRCNVLPRALEPERFVSDSSRALVRRLLRSWPLEEQRAFFEQDLRVPLKLEEDTGKYFPVSDRARDIRDRLLACADRAGVLSRFETRLTDLTRRDDGWTVQTTTGAIEADAVIVATGGQSVPATGSDGAGFALAARLGHTIHPPYPALTPLICHPAPHGSLSGISLDVRIRAKWQGKTTESRGGFLFTHHGYSGPAVLDVSHVAVRSNTAGPGERAVLRVRWCELDSPEWTSRLIDAAGLVLTIVSRELPGRLAAQLLVESHIPLDRRAATLTRAERLALVHRLTSYELPWTGDEGYKKAEVTGGGIALEELNPHTLESRRAPQVFFCGEVLDAFGPIGGHNFSWAWATGRTAGLAQQPAISSSCQ
jgi:predicted Rossmann fold flavoprotein